MIVTVQLEFNVQIIPFWEFIRCWNFGLLETRKNKRWNRHCFVLFSGMRDPEWRYEQSVLGALHGMEHPLWWMGQEDPNRGEFDVDAQSEAEQIGPGRPSRTKFQHIRLFLCQNWSGQKRKNQRSRLFQVRSHYKSIATPFIYHIQVSFRFTFIRMRKSYYLFIHFRWITAITYSLPLKSGRPLRRRWHRRLPPAKETQANYRAKKRVENSRPARRIGGVRVAYQKCRPCQRKV